MELDFKTQLWEGTAAVYERYSEGKAQSKDVLAICTARVAVEERYAKEMGAVAAKAHALSDNGSLTSAWVAIRETHTTLAEVHASFARKVSTELVKPLSDDIRDRSAQKNALAEEDRNLHAQLAKSKAACEAAFQRYMRTAESAEAAKKQFHFAQQDASMPPKKLKAMETQEAKLTSDAERAHEQYKAALADLNAFQKTYETGMLSVLAKLQELDEARARLLQSLLQVYLEAHLSLQKLEAEVGIKIGTQVKSINAASDLQTWIDANKTGAVPEDLVQYQGYESQYSNASPDDVPNPSKIRSKMPLKKSGVAPPVASGGDKKLQRQKSLSRILGGRSKGVSKKDSSVNVASDAVTSSPAPRRTSGAATTAATGAVVGKPVSSPAKGATAASSSPTNTTAATSAAAGKPRKGGGRRAKALFEFVASDDTELSFRSGDIVTVVRVDDSGWWDAQLGDNEGLVPGNYLEFIEEAISEEDLSPPGPAPTFDEPSKDDDDDYNDSVPTKLPPAPQAPSPRKEAAAPVVAAPAAPVAVAASAAANQRSAPPPQDDEDPHGDDSEELEEGEPIGVVVALYEFAGDAEDELPLRVGDRVEIYAEVEGWYTGCNAEGRYGLFPANFAKRVDE